MSAPNIITRSHIKTGRLCATSRKKLSAVRPGRIAATMGAWGVLGGNTQIGLPPLSPRPSRAATGRHKKKIALKGFHRWAHYTPARGIAKPSIDDLPWKNGVKGNQKVNQTERTSRSLQRPIPGEGGKSTAAQNPSKSWPEGECRKVIKPNVLNKKARGRGPPH